MKIIRVRKNRTYVIFRTGLDQFQYAGMKVFSDLSQGTLVDFFNI